MAWRRKFIEYLTQQTDRIAEEFLSNLNKRAGYTHPVADLVERAATLERCTLLVRMLIRGMTEDVSSEIENWAQTNGTQRAKANMSIDAFLESFTIFRKTARRYFTAYFKTHVATLDYEEFDSMEERFFDLLDQFQERFSYHYISYKDVVIQSQQHLIGELAVPVIPVTDDTCILPLIGAIDTHRAKQIMEGALARITELRAKYMVLDVSGVMVIDTMVAHHLFDIVKALRLMGTNSIITGIQPEVAQTIVQLGVSMIGKVETMASLRQALRRIEEHRRQEEAAGRTAW
ncbi:rsbT co-antagonist protein RsbR [Tumebacillus sp. BK434]|uniref:STAS domain-containing protein n=1 Tax=Tumebacillus sp. BK434 TaxID=2512169 RepID=UPI00104677CD|nr:STAS domain-containing protein [Tumebacillus sp. BK434]TCP55876.1 rsbT co-antagonist protein RsbR [Tumebacillus sp. BK434]